MNTNHHRSLPILVASAISLSGCASTHDLRKGAGIFGGGVMHREVKPGLFLIRAQTNWAPWPNLGSAQGAWKDEAKIACEGKSWMEINIVEGTRDTGKPSMGILKYLVSEKFGYVLCEGAITSENEARDSLK
jgi:hypothetical protein